VCPGRRPLRRLVKRLRPSTSWPATRTGISAVIAVDVIGLEIRRSHVTLPGGDYLPAFRTDKRPGLLPAGHGGRSCTNLWRHRARAAAEGIGDGV
jgi:hypothetical protein